MTNAFIIKTIVNYINGNGLVDKRNFNPRLFIKADLRLMYSRF
jgi:hypothetical protein